MWNKSFYVITENYWRNLWEDINNKNVNEEDTEVENNIPAVVIFTESSAASNTLKNYIDQNHYSQTSLEALL